MTGTKAQTLVRLRPDNYDWLRRTAFERQIPQSQVIEELIDTERDHARQQGTGRPS